MNREFSEISQQLETWYARDGGEFLYEALRDRLRPLLDVAFGYHTLQLGPLPLRNLLGPSPINHRILAGEEPAAGVSLVCHCGELPLESDSIDMVVALHTLDFCATPHQCLREMQRVLTPHGQLLIVGFNPASLLGLSQRARGLARRGPWRALRPVSQGRLTDWLHLVGCELEQFHHVCPLPLWGGEGLRRTVSRVDNWAMRRNLPGGSLYIAHAIKEVPNIRRVPERLAVPRRLMGLVPKPAASSGGMPRHPRRQGGDSAA